MSLKNTIELVDRVSDKFDSIGSSGAAAMQKIGSSTASANAAVAQYDASAVAAGKATLEWTDKIGNYDKSAMQAIYSTEELIEEGYAVAVALDDAGDSADAASDSIGDLGDQVDDVGDDFEKSGDKSEEFGDKSKTAIGDLDDMLATAGIAAAVHQITEEFLECAAAAEELESADAQLATIAGLSNMSSLTPDILELSNASGIAAKELDEVTYNAISAGTAVEDSVNMTKTATELAEAGFTNSSAALSVLSTAMNSYGDQIKSVTDVSDSLITVQNLGVTTVDQLAAQMGKAIATAAAYDVSLGNVESAYISVTKAGINTAEGTTYISGMLNELGKSSSDIAGIIRAETGQSFGQLMNEGASLADVLGIVYNSVNQNSEAMINLFGSQEAGKAAMAIINQGLDTFNKNLDAVQNSAGATASAYAIMADTTEYAHKRMDNAILNTKTVIGTQLNSTLKDLYSAGAAIFEGVGGFLNKAPAVTAILTGATVGVAALTVGVTAYTAITKYGTVIQTAFNAAMSANPLFWIVPVIIGVVAAAGVLINVMSEANEEYNSLTASSKAHYRELENLKSEYEAVAASQGEASEEAVRLATEIEVQSAVFESTKMTIEEWNSRLEASAQKHDDLTKSVNDLMISQSAGEYSISHLTDRLTELTSKTELSAAEQEECSIVVDLLNEKVEGLGLTFDEASGKTNKSAAEIQNFYKVASQTEFIDTAKDKINELYDAMSENEVNLLFADEDVKAAQAAYDAAERAYEEYVRTTTETGGTVGPFSHWAWTHTEAKALEDAKAAYEELETANADYQDQIDTLTDKINDNTNAVDTGNEIANTAIEEQMTAINNLAAAYDTAYQEALSSFSGQFGLFDEAKANADSTVSATQSALDSQLAYWNDYAANIQTLTAYENQLSGEAKENFHELMANVQNGSEEAAGLAQSMVNSINQGNDEAVTKLADTYSKVQEQQQNAAAQVADWQTNFSQKLAQIEQDMNKTVSEMNKSQEAQAAASATVNAYIAAIAAGTSRAHSAAQSVANAAASGFNSGGTPSTPHHAEGTTNAESAFIAGDKYGPELVVDHPGATVFPHSETMKIVEAVGETYYDEPPEDSEPIVLNTPLQNAIPSEESESSTSEKTIHIDINGSGKMTFSGGMDENAVLNLLVENMKPVLLNMLAEENAEEGDDIYEY